MIKAGKIPRYITAPNEYTKKEEDIKVFLAGGITDCEDWQSSICDYISRTPVNLSSLAVFNPRRTNFPIGDPNAAHDQISWEFKYLNEMDIFSMYFAKSNKSVQPICLYELGRYLVKMQERFPDDWEDRIVISCHPKYQRIQDVKIQTELATGRTDLVVETENVRDHGDRIIAAFQKFSKRK